MAPTCPAVSAARRSATAETRGECRSVAAVRETPRLRNARSQAAARCSTIVNSLAMHVDYDPSAAYDPERAHPWTVADDNERHRYYDFREEPQLIRSVLEDFAPHSRQPAVRLFYALLEWLNGPDSELETCDCAFRPPEKLPVPENGFRYHCSGRLVLLFRDLSANTDRELVDAFAESLAEGLRATRPDFRAGFFRFVRMPTRFLDLSPPRGELGDERSIIFFAYGNSVQSCFDNLAKMVRGLTAVLRSM